ncbi:Leucine rich repeat protein bspa family [Entamoeba marina]
MKIGKNDNFTQLDSYSMLICSKYFKKFKDFVNLICVNSKFKETTEKLRFNPIPITSMKLFPKIQTQYLYSCRDTKIDGIDNYKIVYKVDYKEYLNIKDKFQIKCLHIEYTKNNIKEYGNDIPFEVNILGDYLFDSNQTKIIIPSHVTQINHSCFCHCKNLSNIILPNTLTELSAWCFATCPFTSINIPQSIQFINNNCFNSCNNLSLIDIPNSVTSIQNHCFHLCTNLCSVTLPTTLTILQHSIFNRCSSLKI